MFGGEGENDELEGDETRSGESTMTPSRSSDSLSARGVVGVGLERRLVSRLLNFAAALIARKVLPRKAASAWSTSSVDGSAISDQTLSS